MLLDFKIGDNITHTCIFKVQKTGVSKNGGVYARGTLQDTSGTVNFITFNSEVVDFLKEEQSPIIKISGNVQLDNFSQNKANQIIVERVDIPLPDEDLSHLLPYTSIDVDQYQKKLADIITNITKPHVQILLKNIFMGELQPKFLKAPAATYYHHACVGGLLEHTVDVAELTIVMCSKFDSVDKDIATAGALLHDIGKIKELSADIGFERTDKGKFIGHITLGAFIVENAISAIKGFPKEDALEIMHIVLAHHGALEYGSPVLPATRESLIVSAADNINALIDKFDMLASKDKAEWQYCRMLSRNIKVN